MKVASIFLFCLLGATLLSTVLCNSSSTPDECCFELYNRPVNKNLITSYYKVEPRCPTGAVILITKKSRRLCVDPNERWVKRIIDFLEKKSM